MTAQNEGGAVSNSLHIGGMTCVNCQNRIEKMLKSLAGIEEARVNYRSGTAAVTWNPAIITPGGIRAAIEALGYQVLDGAAKTPFPETAGTLFIILALYVLLRELGTGVIVPAFSPAEAGAGYGMLFVTGLMTSVHCAAMCGGINISQSLRKGPPALQPLPAEGSSAVPPAEKGASRPLAAPLLYNTGRVISYTAAGVIVGALGQVITVSGRFQGIVQIIAGVFMAVMGVNMLGLFPALRRFSFHLPDFLRKKTAGAKADGRGPLLAGLLNGLMPCGPLQAMQLYALSTGSPLAGGISMFLFSAGTVPLMFGIGALGSFLSGVKGRAFSAKVLKAGAVLVTVMGMMMFTWGWGLSGFNFSFVDRAAAAMHPFRAGAARQAPVMENGVQRVNSVLSPGRYPAITVERGIPVRWTIDAPGGSINGCNNRMIIREYGIEHRFTPGENVITFTPEKTGRFPYSCWMGMIRSSITVVAEGDAAAPADEADAGPVPAGVVIPSDKVALAEIRTEAGASPCQEVTISLRDDGIEPAIIVVQRGIPAIWTITNDSLDPGNSRLIFPAYYTQTGMKQGDNIIRLMPSGDFDFSTADNVFYGYVKVVDDLDAVDIDAVKAGVENFETMIYPDSWFESAAQGGCCGAEGP